MAETIDATKGAGVVKASSVKHVIVDTTVMSKVIAHPTDLRLVELSREHRVKAATRDGIKLRMSYNREVARLVPLRARKPPASH